MNRSHQIRSLVFYAYFEKNIHHIEALRFFIDIGVRETDPVDYVFIIQGFNCSVQLPKYDNIRILFRPNSCYDFGSYKNAIDLIGGEEILKKYKAIIFINSSVFGPFLPKYWPPYFHWSDIFASMLNYKVRLVGTVLSCLPDKDADAPGPRISGMAFATTSDIAIRAYNNNVFACFQNKNDAILKGEYAISRLVLNLGYNMDTLLAKYGNLDWRRKTYWNCNDKRFPFFKNKYGNNIDIHPFETVFYKPLWLWEGEVVSESYLNETYEYMKWARDREEI